MNRYDFEQNGGIENWNGKLKNKNCNKPRKISDFLIETEKKQSGNLKRKITTNRERFLTFFIHFGIEQQSGNTKKKIETKRQISDFDK